MKNNLLLTSTCKNICLTYPNENTKAVLEYCASGNYLTVRCRIFNKWIMENPINVRLPNNLPIQNTHKAYLPMSGLLKSEILVRILPQLSSSSLILIVHLCDAGWKTIFDKNVVKITKDRKILLTWYHKFIDKLWGILLGVFKNNIVSNNAQDDR